VILTLANGDFSENLATVWGFRLPSKWAHCARINDGFCSDGPQNFRVLLLVLLGADVAVTNVGPF
jgi:hypothetical protein